MQMMELYTGKCLYRIWSCRWGTGCIVRMVDSNLQGNPPIGLVDTQMLSVSKEHNTTRKAFTPISYNGLCHFIPGCPHIQLSPDLSGFSYPVRQSRKTPGPVQDSRGWVGECLWALGGR